MLHEELFEETFVIQTKLNEHECHSLTKRLCKEKEHHTNLWFDAPILLVKLFAVRTRLELATPSVTG